MFQLPIRFKNPKRIIIVSSRYLICSFIAISQTFFLQLQNENLLKSLKQWNNLVGIKSATLIIEFMT